MKGGKEKLLVDGAKVEPRDAVLSEVEKSRRERARTAGEHGVIDYKWDEVGAQILIPPAATSISLTRKRAAVKQVGATEGGATDAKISPEGWLRSLCARPKPARAGGEKRPRRGAHHRGARCISFGMAEFVAQEEMDRFTGYWTSPDDQRIAFARVDEAPVDVLSLSEIGADGTTVLSKRYPRAGRPNAVVELYVAPITGGTRVKVDFV